MAVFDNNNLCDPLIHMVNTIKGSEEGDSSV